MKLWVRKYPNPTTLALCEEVPDEFPEVGEGELLSIEQYKAWLSEAKQQEALAKINSTAEGQNLERIEALNESRITALTATGISRKTAIALLNLQSQKL